MSSKARRCQACGREIEDTHGSLSGMHRECMGFILKIKLTRRWKKKQKHGLKERRQRKLVNENTQRGCRGSGEKECRRWRKEQRIKAMVKRLKTATKKKKPDDMNVKTTEEHLLLKTALVSTGWNPESK